MERREREEKKGVEERQGNEAISRERKREDIKNEEERGTAYAESRCMCGLGWKSEKVGGFRSEPWMGGLL